jgi:hypothetical protein
MEEMAVLFLDEDTNKKTWKGVIRTIAADQFAYAVKRCHEHCEQSIQAVVEKVEKV